MKTDRRAELIPPDLDVIRVETALSRFPVHRLAKAGTVRIDLREATADGQLAVLWRVSHNSEYGQPGPLAYKLDTLAVNRRLEATGRPTPRIVRLGSLNGICRELGMAVSGKNTADIKRALYQNAFAGITAKIRYGSSDGAERTLEAGFTRYAVVFTGERLPDGRAADAVYLVLSDIYMQVLDGAVTRPLDYGYLRELPPASQRWYELASYAMYAALKHRRPTARLSYAEFCTHAPQARYLDWEHARVQMWKIHAPHRKAGYIADVTFESTTDREGRPDWAMIYTPGPKARAEYRAFTGKGRSVAPAIEPPPAEPEPEPEPAGLEAELVARGVTRCVAADLVRDFGEDRIRAQITNLDGRRKVKDPGAWLAAAIRNGYATKAEPAVKAAPAAAPVTAEDRPERAREAAIAAYWGPLNPAERARIDAEALAAATPEIRADYEAAARPVKRAMIVPIRDAYLATRLPRP